MPSGCAGLASEPADRATFRGVSSTAGTHQFRVHPEPWIAFQPALDEMLAPIGQVALAAAALQPGDSALDVGCGCGTTTMQLAAAVGSDGSATGIDTSAALLDVARRAVAAADVANATFVEGDAGTHPYGAHAYDVIFSRLGTMFFPEPAAAFANLRRALRPGGRLSFVCWRSIEENQWTAEVRDAAAVIVPLPPSAPDDAPGPFSLASADRVSSILTRSGFVDVSIEPVDLDLTIGRGDVDEAIEFYLRLLPTGYLLFDLDRHLLDRLSASLRVVLERHRGPDGLRLGSASWLVLAH